MEELGKEGSLQPDAQEGTAHGCFTSATSLPHASLLVKKRKKETWTLQNAPFRTVGGDHTFLGMGQGG